MEPSKSRAQDPGLPAEVEREAKRRVQGLHSPGRKQGNGTAQFEVGTPSPRVGAGWGGGGQYPSIQLGRTPHCFRSPGCQSGPKSGNPNASHGTHGPPRLVAHGAGQGAGSIQKLPVVSMEGSFPAEPGARDQEAIGLEAWRGG